MGFPGLIHCYLVANQDAHGYCQMVTLACPCAEGGILHHPRCLTTGYSGTPIDPITYDSTISCQDSGQLYGHGSRIERTELLLCFFIRAGIPRDFNIVGNHHNYNSDHTRPSKRTSYLGPEPAQSVELLLLILAVASIIG